MTQKQQVADACDHVRKAIRLLQDERHRFLRGALIHLAGARGELVAWQQADAKGEADAAREEAV